MSKYINSRTAPVYLLGLVLIMFADVLAAPLFGHQTILSQHGEDLETQFLYWYDFGFRELRHGHLALWNPYVFCGTPWFGNFESALLYPINWLFCILPAYVACNWVIAIHVFLCGWFTFLWIHRRGLQPVFALVASTLLMLGSPFFMRVVPGHMTNLAAMAWTPLVLLATDGLWDAAQNSGKRRALKYALAGVLAVSMQIFAGHPQSVFRTGVMVALYLLLRILFERPRLRPMVFSVGGVLGFYLLAAGIGAVQLLAGLDVAAESTRRAGVPYEFVSMLSFPPENLLTLLAPTFFGNELDLRYWGRWLPWETTLFWSVTGLLLSAIGAVRLIKRREPAIPVLLLVLLVLALGHYTPLFRLLFDYVPGFNKFRVSAEYLYPMALFGALLAAQGLETLRTRAVASPRLICGLAAATLLLAIFIGATGIWLQNSIIQGAQAPLARLMLWTLNSGQSSVPDAVKVLFNYEFVSSATTSAAANLYLCAGILLLAAFLIWRIPSSPRAVYLLALLAFCEVWGFARAHRPAFDLSRTHSKAFQEFVASHPRVRSGEERVLNLTSLNSGMRSGSDGGAHDIWGYDPVMLDRYTEWSAWSQGDDPDEAVVSVNIHRPHRLYPMLRCRYVIVRGEAPGEDVRIADLGPVLPRALLITRYRVLPGRDEQFAAMAKPDFNPAREVLLESPPPFHVAPSPQPGTVTIESGTTDTLILKANISQPCILLLTDSYSKYWKVRSRDGAQTEPYLVQPANYTLCAVPLKPGVHKLELYYRPNGFVLGKWVSILALMLLIGGVLYCIRARI